MKVKDLQTFEQLDQLVGNDFAVRNDTDKLSKLPATYLCSLENAARKHLRRFNGNSRNVSPTFNDIRSAILLSGIRKEWNRRRDEIEEKVKKDLEKNVSDRTIYECTKVCDSKEAERFRRIRRLYRKLKRLRRKLRSREREYRWEYETIIRDYHDSKSRMFFIVFNYLLHPTKAKIDGEYGACKNDKRLMKKIKKNRSKIRKVKEKMLKIIKRRKPSLYDKMNKIQESFEENIEIQNYHQTVENDDFKLVKDILTAVCPPSHKHDFLDCPNVKKYKNLRNFFSYATGKS